MKLKKIIFILALLIFLGALGYLGAVGYSYYSAGKAYEELAEAVVTRQEGTATGERGEGEGEGAVWEPLAIDFGALQEISEDAVLWIDIPGTPVSYPVAQASDNDYYLKRNLSGSYNFAGTVFMDFRNDPSLSDDNTILYGHNMRNGSMFGILSHYADEEFYKSHPEIDLYLPGRILRCTILSSHQEEAEEENFPTRFETEEEKLAFISRMKARACYDTGTEAGAEDHLVTLVTCTGNGYTHRWVVQAKVTQEIETAEAGTDDSGSENPQE